MTRLIYITTLTILSLIMVSCDNKEIIKELDRVISISNANYIDNNSDYKVTLPLYWHVSNKTTPTGASDITIKHDNPNAYILIQPINDYMEKVAMIKVGIQYFKDKSYNIASNMCDKPEQATMDELTLSGMYKFIGIEYKCSDNNRVAICWIPDKSKFYSGPDQNIETFKFTMIRYFGPPQGSKTYDEFKHCLESFRYLN